MRNTWECASSSLVLSNVYVHLDLCKTIVVVVFSRLLVAYCPHGQMIVSEYWNGGVFLKTFCRASSIWDNHWSLRKFFLTCQRGGWQWQIDTHKKRSWETTETKVLWRRLKMREVLSGGDRWRGQRMLREFACEWYPVTWHKCCR